MLRILKVLIIVIKSKNEVLQKNVSSKIKLLSKKKKKDWAKKKVFCKIYLVLFNQYVANKGLPLIKTAF